MKRFRYHLPAIIIGAMIVAALAHGPVEQLANYHDFADTTARFGIPHFCDVVSNFGFALVALWGWFAGAVSSPGRREEVFGYRLFLVGLFLTAFGSSWYHLAPDDARLVWDRLPISLACAGLLSGVWADTRRRSDGLVVLGLSAFAAAGVAWWRITGDLRPYLALQIAALVLVPLWQWLSESPRKDQAAFGLAVVFYVVAKLTELYDHQIGAVLGGLTGHTLKHLLATAAAAVIIHRLIRRAPENVVAASDRIS